MAYVNPDFKTKKALKDALAAGAVLRPYNPGMGFPTTQNGTEFLEGPHLVRPGRSPQRRRCEGQVAMTTTDPLYTEYMEWRALGFRAISAYLITRMGFLTFVIERFAAED
jgi:hypothetical protein